MKLKTVDLFHDLDKTLAGEYLAGFEYPWECLAGISDFVVALGKALPPALYDETQEHVWIAESARIAPTATVMGPVIIGENTEVRPSAFIRGSVLVGNGCVVGNSTELKNCILFDGVQVPHFNYVGDSVLGYCSHMGAGAVTSNVKSDKSPVVVKNGGERIPTNRKKAGAFLGSRVEVGCSSVLNPGTVIGENTAVYPLCCVRGCVPPNHIVKGENHIIRRRTDYERSKD